ncbi:MAG: hypothetical protein ACYCSQ_05090 [bacterium]
MLSLIPIEFFTYSNCNYFKDKLVPSIFKEILTEDKSINNFKKIFGTIHSINNSNIFKDNRFNNVFIVFIETSVCIVIEEELDNIKFYDIYNLLIRRQKLHTNIINKDHEVLQEILNIVKDLNENKSPDGYKSKINYVYTFFINSISHNIMDCQRNFAKILSSPSLIRLDDDMLLDDGKCNFSNNIKIKEKYLDAIQDIDINSNSEIFINWGSMVALCYSDATSVSYTKNLLLSLEIRLQTLWNRCYSINQEIELYFENNSIKSKKIFFKRNIFRQAKSFEEIFWNVMPTFNKTKNVLHASYSFRINSLFDEMIKASRIISEVTNLESKMELLGIFLRKELDNANKQYQKIIEILLFIIALSSFVYILVPVPIIHNSLIAWIFIAIIFIIGLYIIGFIKR